MEQILVKIADFWSNFFILYARAINVECNYILRELFVFFFPSLPLFLNISTGISTPF